MEITVAFLWKHIINVTWKRKDWIINLYKIISLAHQKGYFVVCIFKYNTHKIN